ncbi:hypothetical protein D3C87_1763320 [compost metagenome]
MLRLRYYRAEDRAAGFLLPKGQQAPDELLHVAANIAGVRAGDILLPVVDIEQ